MPDAMLWSCKRCSNVRSTSWPSEPPEDCPACEDPSARFTPIGNVSR